MKNLKACVLVIALAFSLVPAEPFGGVVPMPTVGGEVLACGGGTIAQEQLVALPGQSSAASEGESSVRS